MLRYGIKEPLGAFFQLFVAPTSKLNSRQVCAQYETRGDLSPLYHSPVPRPLACPRGNDSSIMGKLKRKRAATVLAKKTQKLEGRELNPFEVRVNRKKHHVLGQRSKSDRGLPGVSRSKAILKVNVHH